MDQSIKKALQAERLYLILAGLFIASLVAGNLIFQKFFHWDFFGIYTFELSVGILPYPVTFLITDLIAEIYGKRRANQVVIAGLGATMFVLLILSLANAAPATDYSPVNDRIFTQVFGLAPLAVAASMIAYLLAQLVDIRLYHFWKDFTKGKHLWLRNNASTMTSQFVDTASVLLLLCLFQAIEWNLFWPLLWSGFFFKVMIAALDTPILYLLVYSVRRHFDLEVDQEIRRQGSFKINSH